jgi:hypothetical protein
VICTTSDDVGLFMNWDGDNTSFFIVKELDSELAFGTPAAGPDNSVKRQDEGVVGSRSNLESWWHQHFHRPRTIFCVTSSELAISIAAKCPYSLASGD